MRKGFIAVACLLSMGTLAGCDGDAVEVNLPALPTATADDLDADLAEDRGGIDAPGQAVQEGATVSVAKAGNPCPTEGDVAYSTAGVPLRCSVIKCDHKQYDQPRWHHLC